MLCPPYSDQWTTEIGAWRDTEGGAGQGSGSCCHCSTAKKYTYVSWKKGFKYCLVKKNGNCVDGWVLDGFISSWFLFNVLFFWGGGGGGYCENSHPSLSYLKKSIKIVISK